MSKFKNGRVYLVLSENDVTAEVVNWSTSRSKDTMPTKAVGGVNKYLVEFMEPMRDELASFVWYDQDEIVGVWEAL